MPTVTQTPVPARSTPRRRTATAAPGAAGHRWVYVVLAGGLVLLVGPFVWMLLGSFKTDAELRQVPPTWLPESATTDNYRQLFTQLDFPQFFLNSTLVAVTVTVGNLVFCSMLGYALAKLRFPGRRVVFALVLGMLMVPGMVTFVPLFMVVSRLGMVDSYPGLILPWLASPFGVFLMRQFILGLPDDLIQAARVDGAGEFRIFLRVVLPLCGPALATLGILQFLSTWNNFLWPLVVAQSEDRYTLPVALALYAVGENSTRYGLLMAGAVVTILPILVIFVLLQRHFVQGIAMTGLK